MTSGTVQSNPSSSYVDINLPFLVQDGATPTDVDPACVAKWMGDKAPKGSLAVVAPGIVKASVQAAAGASWTPQSSAFESMIRPACFPNVLGEDGRNADISKLR